MHLWLVLGAMRTAAVIAKLAAEEDRRKPHAQVIQPVLKLVYKAIVVQLKVESFWNVAVLEDSVLHIL